MKKLFTKKIFKITTSFLLLTIMMFGTSVNFINGLLNFNYVYAGDGIAMKDGGNCIYNFEDLKSFKEKVCSGDTFEGLTVNLKTNITIPEHYTNFRIR